MQDGAVLSLACRHVQGTLFHLHVMLIFLSTDTFVPPELSEAKENQCTSTSEAFLDFQNKSAILPYSNSKPEYCMALIYPHCK